MTEIAVKQGYNWTKEVKESFVLDYAQTGNLTTSSQKMGIPYDTARMWARSEWFQDQLSTIEAEANRALAKRLQNVQEQLIGAIEDRIKVGDQRVTRDGEIVDVKAPLASLTISYGTLFDKAQVLKRNPSANDSTEDILSRLADKLRDAIQKPKAVDVIDIDMKESAEQ
jgi:hypothetical protein